MTSQHVEIPDHEADFIRQCVLDGRYKDAGEVVQAGLRLLEQQEAEECQKRERFRAEVQRGVDDLENGRYFDVKGPEEFAAFFDDIDREAEDILSREQNESCRQKNRSRYYFPATSFVPRRVTGHVG